MPHALSIVLSAVLASGAAAQSIVVDTSHVVNSFSPPRALGGAIDRLRGGATKEDNEKHTERLLTGSVLQEMLGAGWGTVTYRQNTELMIEAWHWNPRGTWSNVAKQEGYFSGGAEPTDDEDSPFVGLSAPSSRRHPRRRHRLVPPHRR